MKVLVAVEHKDGKLKKIARELIGASEKIGDVEVAVVGFQLSSVVEELKKYNIKKLYVAENKALKEYSSEVYTTILEKIVEDSKPQVVFFGDTSFGADLGPKLATRLKAGFLADCTDFEVRKEDLIFTRPIYAGKVISKAKINTTLKILTLRPKAFDEAKPSTSSPEVVEIQVPEVESKTKVLEVTVEKSERPELTEAEIVVSGGRGFKTKENFQLCYELADLLGAAVGSSRAASDAGFIDAQYEVGQTGKVVAPTLYIAIAISGAIQHQVGMNRSKYIVSINKDPDAPIFQITDFGIVDDLFKFVPLLIEELKKIGKENT